VNHIERSSAGRAVELGRAFDRAFAEARHDRSAPTDDFLAVRIGLESYAVRLSEISGVFADKAIARLPAKLPALIGAVGFRGAILPAYDLAVLLGYPPTGSARWLVIAASDPVALALGEFDGHRRLSRDACVAQETGSDAVRPHVREVIRAPDQLRPVIHLRSVIDAIKQQVRQDASPRRSD
jgi:chemotaxis signal transduction protein